jgi:hypothetical protein
MKTRTLLTLLFAGSALPAAASTLIFADNFNAPDTGNLDLSDQAGRRSGLNPAIQVRSSKIQHGIAGGQLNFLNADTGRTRFHNDLDNNNTTAETWHDWATSPAAAQILSEGGLRVEFDWIAGNNVSENWVAFNIGHNAEGAGEPGFRVNDGSNDVGILFRFSGATQVFDNGVAQPGAGNFPATIGPRHVMVDYGFTSFADGSPVSMKAWVDGVTVFESNTFTWAGNSGQLYMELETLENTRIDNLAISTIPEPSVAALAGFCAAGVLVRRRRK